MCHYIKDKCPVCHEEYEWDDCHDTYTGTKEIIVEVEGQREVTLFICPVDGGTVGILVLDDVFGGNVYIPSQKTL